MNVFINGTGIISPTSVSDGTNFPESIAAPQGIRFRCQEPDYKNYIPAGALRRMSRIIKMGIASARMCLASAGTEKPGAIITGTGLGCIEDTENFLNSIIDNEEKMLTPTAFIQSTHNTVGGQIALAISCHEYNFTYVHRGLSFEHALLDAILMIQEANADNILVGGIDELTDNSYRIMQQLGLYSRNENKGMPAGEGSAFFMLSSAAGKHCLARLSGIHTYCGSLSQEDFLTKTERFLSESNKTISDIDMVLSGDYFNAREDKYYQYLKNIFPAEAMVNFKNLCGEYHTASAYALWLAAGILHSGSTPAGLMDVKKSVNTILIYNHSGQDDHSWMLLERC